MINIWREFDIAPIRAFIVVVDEHTATTLVHELMEARDDKQLLQFQERLAGYNLHSRDEWREPPPQAEQKRKLSRPSAVRLTPNAPRSLPGAPRPSAPHDGRRRHARGPPVDLGDKLFIQPNRYTLRSSVAVCFATVDRPVSCLHSRP